MKTFEQQIAEHLRREAPFGIPKEWLQREDVSASVAGASLEQARPIIEAVEKLRSAEKPSSGEGSSSAVVTSTEANGEYSLVSLEQLRQIAEKCVKCRLCEGRNKVVFGVGNANRPLIAFVGEGPGADEDRVGEPFVGRAGALLTAAITKGLGLQREDVYIANVVKCRPPENRAPLPDETAACTPYLYRQLEIIQPSVIVTLGQPAQMALSGVQMGITKLRGNWQTWRGIKLMPTFHPAYLLRNPPAKKFFWEDLKSVMTEVGLPMPKSGGAL